MGEKALQRMDRCGRAAVLAVLATAVLLGAGSARAGDGNVTIVGSTWQERQLAAPVMLGPPPGAAPAPEGDLSFSASGEGAAGPVARQPGADGNLPDGNRPEGDADDDQGSPQAFTWAAVPLERNWYAKFDYFCWKEQATGVDTVDEHGTLYTIGYKRCRDAKRLRIEAFTGTMNSTTGIDWRSEDLGTITRYMGVRTEFELLWDWNHERLPPSNCYVGLGTRFWIRDIKDSEFIPGFFTVGHQENWVTLYPYVGMEKCWHSRTACMDFFLSGRVGATAWTYQSCASLGGPVHYPAACPIGLVELGFTYENLITSVSFEAMTWARSAAVGGESQPPSQLYMTGVKIGLRY